MRYAELCEQVTDTIVERIERGDAGTWVMPWHSGPANMGELFRPVNATTGAAYTGANVMFLLGAMLERGYTRNVWATFKQWKEAGASVRKGETASRIVKWVPAKRGEQPEEGETAVVDERGQRIFPKVYAVFNAAQVDGWADPDAPTLFDTPADPAATPETPEWVARWEAWVAATGVPVVYAAGRAFYSPANDRVSVPEVGDYTTPGDYVSTLAHELCHATGHASRVGRQLGNRFGSEAYAAEELVAELGAATICAAWGIAPNPRSDHAAYIASWVRVLTSDSKAIFAAATHAAKAAAWLETAGARAAVTLAA